MSYIPCNMGKHLCGKCSEDVTGIDPCICGLCGTYYHVGKDCSGISRSEMNNFFTKGVAIWICPACRMNFKPNQIHGLIKGCTSIESMREQINELTLLVKELSTKVENSVPQRWPQPVITVPLSTPVVRPGLKTTKRRRGAFGEAIPVSAGVASTPAQGTKTIDLSDLSMPGIIPEPPKPKFWVYLTGLHPLATCDDVRKIAGRCLETNDGIEAVKLVSKDADLSKMSFVSFKIGIDPKLKEKALLASTWPDKLRFREFKNYSTKNDALRTPASETQAAQDQVAMDV